MIPRPRLSDFKVVGLYTGKVIIGVGLLMIVPLVTSICFKEWNPAIEFFIGISACLSFGFLMEVFCQTTRDLSWSQGLVVASFSWFVAMVLGAIPHWLSGHFDSFLDACFDLMSGYTTTGLYLIQDLDHISHGLNMWRHLLTYVGGQGIVVVALTFLFKGTSGAYKIYVGEGKDERLMPNVIQTARAIWLVSLVYLAAGTLALWITGIWLGQGPARGLLHALWIFMGAWSTGGFAPQSYNTFYYHSLVYELITVVFFVIGSFNFALHWAVWTGNRREIRRNIEIVSFFITMTVTMLIVTAGLMKLNVYPDIMALFRKMFYNLASGHTTTGFSTIYSRSYVRQWGPLAMLGVILAMAIGASACSTGGGIKGIRMGIIFKSLIQSIRKTLSPESSVVIEKWHHLGSRILEDDTARSVMFIALAYCTTYGIGALVGVYYGYDLVQALYDSVSAGSNTGLSCGVTAPGMPALLKLTYILQMWAGRLEFISLFALLGYGIALVRGR